MANRCLDAVLHNVRDGLQVVHIDHDYDCGVPTQPCLGAHNTFLFDTMSRYIQPPQNAKQPCIRSRNKMRWGGGIDIAPAKLQSPGCANALSPAHLGTRAGLRTTKHIQSYCAHVECSQLFVHHWQHRIPKRIQARVAEPSGEGALRCTGTGAPQSCRKAQHSAV